MSISQYTALNTTALITPDLHVIIVPPSQLTIKGVSSNIAAVIGTASWGPVLLDQATRVPCAPTPPK